MNHTYSPRSARFGRILTHAAVALVFAAAVATSAAAQSALDDATVVAPVAAAVKTPAPAAEPPTHPWLGAPAASAGAPAPSPGDDEHWHFAVMPYGFLSALDGQLRAGDRSVEVDRSFGDITDVLKFAAGIRVESQEEKWGFNFDNNYIHLGDDVTTAERLVPDYRFDLSLNVTEFEPTYRLWKTGEQEGPAGGPKFAVDVIGGVRVVHFSTDLELRRLIADDEFRSGSSTYVHGYVGNRFVGSPSRYLTLEGRYNVALASDFSWFVNANADIRPWEHFSFGAGLQVLDLSLENDSNETALDARLFGPTVFLKFHF